MLFDRRNRTWRSLLNNASSFKQPPPRALHHRRLLLLLVVVAHLLRQPPLLLEQHRQHQAPAMPSSRKRTRCDTRTLDLLSTLISRYIDLAILACNPLLELQWKPLIVGCTSCIAMPTLLATSLSHTHTRTLLNHTDR